MRMAAFGFAEALAQKGVHPLPQTIAFPESEVMIHRAPRSEVLGQVAPLAAGFGEVKDGIEQLAEGMLARSTSLCGLGKAMIDELPFGVGEVRCIAHRKRITYCGTRYKLTLKKFSPFSNRLLVILG